jgi:GNAT superfamily N-acetyltransferase
MPSYNVCLRRPTAEEFTALRRAAGWHVPSAADAANAIERSLFTVCVEEGGECIGSGRVIGDGVLVFYVQDVIVLPEHQRKGCGTAIMNAIMDYVRRTAKPTAIVGLFSARGMESWYARYGFIQRPHGHLGPGMVLPVT